MRHWLISRILLAGLFSSSLLSAPLNARKDVDADGNGVWDDIDAYIAKLPERKRLAATSFARIALQGMANPSRYEVSRYLNAMACLRLVDRRFEFQDGLLDEIAATKDRYLKHLRLEAEAGGMLVDVPPDDRRACASVASEVVNALRSVVIAPRRPYYYYRYGWPRSYRHYPRCR